MRDFTYHASTEIVFGADAETKAGELAKKYGAHRVMLVYGGGSAERSGLLGRIEQSLQAQGLDVIRFGGVRPNPWLSKAEEGVVLARQAGVDLVLGVGGGSSIDTAKAIAIGAANPDADLWDIWVQKTPIRAALPVGAVPTIPAAGSETSNSAVLTNTAIGRKLGINTPFNIPAFALMNPALAVTLPRYQLGCGVVDIMMHTLERYFNAAFDNETTDELAEALLRTVIRNGARVLEDPQDLHAMSEVVWCGSLSHNDLTGLGGTKDFTIHKLSMGLSANYDLAHGASLSCLWQAWAEFVCAAHPERFARLGEKVWGLAPVGTVQAQARAAIDATRDYFRSLDMPVSIPDAGLDLTDAELEALAMGCSQKKTAKIGFFCQLGYDEMLAIYRAAARRH